MSYPHRLDGLKICLAGRFPVDRDALKHWLECLGATVVGSVSISTDIVLAGENPGSKPKYAQDKGIQVLHLSGGELATPESLARFVAGHVSINRPVFLPVKSVKWHRWKDLVCTGKIYVRSGVYQRPHQPLPLLRPMGLSMCQKEVRRLIEDNRLFFRSRAASRG